MTMHRSTLAIGALSLLASAAATPPAHAQPSPADIAQRLLDHIRETSGVPGMAAAVWKDGAILWEGQSGLRDIEQQRPVTPDTLFRLASVSKLFAATAAAKLAEEGRLDLDAPVQAQLPWLQNGWPAITPRQLAAHLSGLPHYQPVDAARGSEHYATGRAAVAIFSNRPLLTPPGDAYRYSSWGYTLLGTLVEERAGIAFTDYVRTRLVPGLAIQADATDSGRTDVSHAYEFDGGRVVPAPRHDYSYSWGGGGLSGTAGAVASFGGRMIDGQVVAPASFAAMLVPAVMTDGRPAGEDDYQVGFGWRSGRDTDGAPYVHHSGVTLGARSTLGLWREERTAVSLLSNALWISRIEPTAQMIAAPFRPVPGGLFGVTCPVGTARYSGHFGDTPVSGPARFAIEGGICTGRIEQDTAMRGYFGTAVQRSDAPLTLIGLSPGDSLARGGLVHPFGIADMRAEPDGSFAADITTSRRLVVRFDQPGK
ncbi:MAG: serine hydrolase domain-containing protein [Sphingopyxis sp.]|uniref:serine hydrolase domain-containing protein n=1 Tax=Sphingopyxis sp. TaxID=1908224 RepID=UPI002ABC4D1C|nr:serine hydrolase domain-containing protein [Sphingopyxis sp.]MDZ3832112.1 serine hydrolase domain-containing protein [Sphingopyxis sp.]